MFVDFVFTTDLFYWYRIRHTGNHWLWFTTLFVF